MCPVVLLALLFSFLLFIMEVTAALVITFNPERVNQLKEDYTQNISFEINNNSPPFYNGYYDLYISDPSIVDVVGDKQFYVMGNQTFNSSFTLKGKFLGHTWLTLLQRNHSKDEINDKLAISVIRPMSSISKIFTVSVAVLVSINYINMGCALDMAIVLAVIKKPIAPIIGFICQYGFMPVIAYFISKLLFDESFYQLGLFTFGCSPGGGASNMWTVLLNGNLNLSIAMTFISTLSALFMMPLWLFTLGKNIYEGTTTSVPLHNIFGSLGSMTIFLGVGLLIQKFLPRVARVCRKILAPVSISMIIFIIIFGTYANLYMFKLMSWKIIVAAALNVWLGFGVGVIAATIFKQPLKDVISISVETGVQNTGVAIVLLGLSLPQPDADIASVIPVAASVVTPIPLTIVYIYIKIRDYLNRSQKLKVHDSISDEQADRSASSKTSNDALIQTVSNEPKAYSNYKNGKPNDYQNSWNSGHV